MFDMPFTLTIEMQLRLALFVLVLLLLMSCEKIFRVGRRCGGGCVGPAILGWWRLMRGCWRWCR